MKTVGIIGGFGPESTIEYYRSIIALYRRRQNENYPSIIINSINLKEILDLIVRNELAVVAERLLKELERLKGAGADFALLAANLLHIVFDEIHRQSPLPLISIVGATLEKAERLNLKRVGLLGARFTMQASFYPDTFLRQGIEVIIPPEEKLAEISEKYLGELVNGIYLPETKRFFLSIIDELKERENIDGVILGGTELPLLLKESEHHGIPLLDTTRIHVDKIVGALTASEPSEN